MWRPRLQRRSLRNTEEQQERNDGTDDPTNRSRKSSAQFRVRVPEGVGPGDTFQVSAEGRIVRVKCPLDVQPGQSLLIYLPKEYEDQQGAPTTARAPTHLPQETRPTQVFVDLANAATSPSSRRSGTSTQRTALVTVPEGCRAGQDFPVTIQGVTIMVTCPQNARPGMTVTVVLPDSHQTESSTIEDSSQPLQNHPPPSSSRRQEQVPERHTGHHRRTNLRNRHHSSSSESSERLSRTSTTKEKNTLFQVKVPPTARPGQSFAALVNGTRLLIRCPDNARPGQSIRFVLPAALLESCKKPTNETTQIRLKFDKDGWARSVRTTDFKLQWVRLDDDQQVYNSMAASSDSRTFHVKKSAFVRSLQILDADKQYGDSRFRRGELSWIPASEAVVSSTVKLTANGTNLVTYADLVRIQGKSFDEKVSWFQEICSKMRVDWDKGHMKMNVRRGDHLIEDSRMAVMSLSRNDMRKVWRFEFLGEEGLEAGGLTREWFELITKALFDPDRGLWKSSAANQGHMQINPACEHIDEDYRVYFRLLGRIMGRALFDRQLVKGHMIQFLYKHMLGWPITFEDLKAVDEDFYNSIRQMNELVENGANVEDLCLDFTVTEEVMGSHHEVELVRGGKDIQVTNKNLPRYLEAYLKYRLMGHVQNQVKELLLGLYDVIPETLLTVFDFQELEFLMCGLPTIDMDDWQENTEYTGIFEDVYSHPACGWFWEVVREFDQEMRARLLQFVTGSSSVPSRGFSVLQGMDGNIRKFTIEGIPRDGCIYPRAHTCFNRIDLPAYESKDELREKLKIAVSMSGTGFHFE